MSSIYKYTQYRPEFFENFFLKISMFGEFNDPFEMVMGNYLSSLPEEEYDEMVSYSQKLSDPASYTEVYWDAQCGVRASVGVLCFTSKEDNLLMWSHYAQNHEGICIEFDSNAEFFNGKYKDASRDLFGGQSPVYKYKSRYENIGVIKPVEYKIERPTYIEPQELEYNTDSWFVKSPEWEYEEEQRLLLPTDLAEEVEKDGLILQFYPLDKKDIKSIILGCQMPAKTKKEVYEKCKALGIQVKEAFIHAHKFKLEIVNYDENNQGNYRNQYNLNRVTKWKNS